MAPETRKPLMNASQVVICETTSLLHGEDLEAAKAPPPLSSFEEAALLARNSVPLIISGVLQQFLGIINVFSVGHLGQVELGAVSLAIMTANISGLAVYQGMATALDTLCAQSYGSGHHHLVGLYFQKMALILLAVTVPIASIWWYSAAILSLIVPDQETAELAGAYLRILVLGAPGLAVFEAGKRFVYAQGIFNATTYILCLVAPLHAVINWLLVWKMQLGFRGAPLSFAITYNVLPLCLFLYVALVDGKQCWNGLTRRAFHGWSVLLSLAIPGFLMLVSEYLAFEVLTLAASHFSTSQLAAQSIISPLVALTLQLSLAISVASSTHVANLIGAAMPVQAKQSTSIAFFGACLVGAINFSFIEILGPYVARLLTNEVVVVHEVIKVLPVIATFQLFDSVSTTSNGIIRGLGKQSIGSLITVACYYFAAIPISFVAAFWLRWELTGLWFGIAVALALHSVIAGTYIYMTSWDQAVNMASARNNAGA